MTPDEQYSTAFWLATILYIAFLFGVAWVALDDDNFAARVQATWVRP